MVKITTQELARVWNMPGFRGYGGISRHGGGCAVCKLKYLAKHALTIDWKSPIGQLGMEQDEALEKTGLGYFAPTETPEQQQIHINYFKKVLQLAIEEGIIEIEDESAKEFLGE